MVETAIVAFTTFFATIGPIDVAVMFAAMTPQASPALRRSMAIRGTLVATLILILFALVGDFLLRSLGISLAALQVAGGILLLLIGIDLVLPGAPAEPPQPMRKTTKPWGRKISPSFHWRPP